MMWASSAPKYPVPTTAYPIVFMTVLLYRPYFYFMISLFYLPVFLKGQVQGLPAMSSGSLTGEEGKELVCNRGAVKHTVQKLHLFVHDA